MYLSITNTFAYDLQFIKEGIRQYDSGNYEQAIDSFSKEIAKNPYNPIAYNRRGNCYLELKQYDKAINDFTKSIKLVPNKAEYYVNRGNAYDWIGKKELAIQDYNKALTLKPNDALVYYNRSIAYYNIGKHENAIKDFDKAIELKPTINNNCDFFSIQIERLKEVLISKQKRLRGAEARNYPNLASSLIGSWKHVNSEKEKTIQLNFYTNGKYDGHLKQKKTIAIDFSGTWKIKDSTLYYVYEKSSSNSASKGDTDKDIIIDITNDFFIIQTINGEIKKYNRINSTNKKLSGI